MSKKPMCTNPVHCTGIANPAHRAQYRHQCPFGKNCQEQNDVAHCDAFAHDLYAAEQRMMMMAPPAMFPQPPVAVMGMPPMFKPPGADAYYMPNYATLLPPVMPGAPLGAAQQPSSKPSSEWFAPAGAGLPPQVSPHPVAPSPLGPGARPFLVSQAPMTGLARAPAANAPQPPFPGFYLNNATAKK